MGMRLLPDDCARAGQWVSLRLDSQLSDFEEVLLEAHLSRCADCRAFADAVAGLTGILRAVPAEEPCFSLQLPQRRGARVHALGVAAGAAAAVVIALSGLVNPHLSSRAPVANIRAAHELMGLKERLLQQLENVDERPVAKAPAGVTAAEGDTLGSKSQVPEPRSTRPATERFQTDGAIVTTEGR